MKNLPPGLRPKQTPAASAKEPSAGTAPAASSTAKTATPRADTAESVRALALVVPDQRLAQLIGPRIRCFVIGPDGVNVTVHVIAAADPHDEDVKLAALLADMGGNLHDLAAAFPNIILGWEKP